MLSVLLLSSYEGASVYSDTKWGLQILLCFTNELREFSCYDGFSAGGTDHPRLQLVVWNKVISRLLGS